MPCHHREDVCQYCMEKVQTTTEDSPPTKLSTTEKEHSLPTPRQKKISIFAHSAILYVLGAAAYYNTKFFLKISDELFHSSLNTMKSLFDTIATRTREE